MAARGFADLPDEVLVKIFGNLESDMVLESRLVRKDWRRVVDDFMEPKIWKPHFPENPVADTLSYFMSTRNRIGTRFSNAEQVEEFMKTVPEPQQYNQDEDDHLFINDTLILQLRSVDQYTSLCKIFPALVARLGKAVRHCVYFVHKDVLESVSNIPIISQMTNLQSLIIYCQNWENVQHLMLLNYLTKCHGGVKLPKKLKSVTVLGDKKHVFLLPLFSYPGSQVKRLHFWGQSLVLDDGTIASAVGGGLLAFPNVEELKLCNVTLPELNALGRWPLKRLSVKIKLEKLNSLLFLGYILDSIEKFAGTLESLHLQFAEKHMFNRLVCYSNFAFPKVTDLRVPYWAGIQSQYVQEFARIFTNMKYLQLVDSEDKVPAMLANTNGIRPTYAIRQALRPLWDQLPDSLEMILVRYRDYNDGNDRTRRHRYVVHRNFQMSPGPTENNA